MAYTAINKSSSFMNTKLYTGTGASNAQTGVGFQPDFVWIKNRDATDSHCLFDAVRGATKVIHADSYAVETTDTDTLDSFTSDGFQVGADVKVNTNTEKYVAWNWKESATAGFDIVAYSGTGSAKTESHSLSAVPYLMIVKRRTNAVNDWAVYHHKNTSAPETDYLRLSTTNATTDSSQIWNDTAPTSSVFSVGQGSEVNDTTSTNIAYLWSEKQGFSKFGSYTGNGNANGPFVYTGFKPAFIMIKAITAGNNWEIFDNKRDGYNDGNRRLYSESNAAEPSASDRVRILSNGFKVLATGSNVNESGSTLVYIAFGQTLVGTNNIPCTAR